MSITKARELIEKPGCGLTVGVLLVLAFAIGFVLTGQYGNRGPGEPVEEARTPIGSIGQFTIFDEVVRRQAQSYGEGDASPIQAADLRATALTSIVESGLRLELAREKGIQPGEDAIKKTIDLQVEVDFMRAAQQSGMDQQRFEEMLKQQTGSTLAELKKQEIEARSAKVKNDPSYRAEITALAVDPLLREAEAKNIKATDDEILKANATLVLKPIQVEAAGGVSAKDRADKALAEIKAGATFESAMDKYSAFAVAEGKKKSSAETEYTVQSLIGDKVRASLRDLKVGQVSTVIEDGPRAFLYKVAKIRELAKKDFDKNKKVYTDQYTNTMANQAIEAQLEKLHERIKWESKGYDLLFQTSKAVSPRSGLSLSERKKVLKELFVSASETVDDLGQEAADMAKLLAGAVLWASATDAEKVGMRKDRIAALKEVAEGDMTLTLELVDLLIAEKDKSVGEYILGAVQTNQDFDEIAAANTKSIVERFTKAKAASLVAAEDAAEIQTQLDRWKKEKAAEDADRKKQEEEDRKQREEDEKARKEAEQKQKDEAKKGGNPQPRPKGSTGGATTG